MKERGIGSSGIKDRGFMDSIYFRDPLGLLIELASYKFEPPFGYTYGQVLENAHKLRLLRGAKNIEDEDRVNSMTKEEIIDLTHVFPLFGYDATQIIIKVYNYIK